MDKKILKLLSSCYLFLLGLVILLAACLRFYRLGDVPHGMTWDEAAIGYNGFAIFHTRRDEWLHRLPISFQSFGDYKAPLAIYLNGVFTTALGMGLWSMRLPFVLAGLMAVWGLIVLTKRFFGSKLALAAGLILALSPWHLHYSRTGFESGLALSFLIWSLCFFYHYLDQKSPRWWSLAASTVMAIASIYSYHSAKIVTPIIFLFLIIKHRQQLLKNLQNLRQLWSAATLSLILISPMIWDTIQGRNLERINTTILGQVSGWRLGVTLVKQWLLHFKPSFLLFGQTTTLRHGDGRWGVLLPTTFILVLIGLVASWSFLKQQRQENLSLEAWCLGIWLVVVGFIPAGVGAEVPHSNRALLALPGFVLLATVGLRFLGLKLKAPAINRFILGSHGERNVIFNTVVGTLLLIHGLFFVAYLNNYYTRFAAESAADFKDGYLEAFAYAAARENEVDKILFTSDYGQPYIYALFVRQTNPIWYQGGSLIKYEFKDEINTGDLMRANTLIVASQSDEIQPDWADYLVYGSDGQVRFKIYLPPQP